MAVEKVYTKPKCLLPLSSGFCPGCLHSLATKLIAEAIDDLGVAEKGINVLPVGCATMNSLYWKLDMVTPPTAAPPPLRRASSAAARTPSSLHIRATATWPPSASPRC